MIQLSGENKFIAVFIGLVVLLWLLLRRTGQHTEVIKVRSTVDGREYLVQNKPDKQQAADMLAQVRQRMMKLVEYLKQHGSAAGNSGPKAPEDDVKKFGEYSERVERLVSRFDPDKISEGNEDAKYTSYTIDKSKMVFCVRARGEGDHVHDLAMMLFVAIHELAHVATITEHHTDEFQSNFAWLLRHAVDAGIYSFEDFQARPRKYCGIDVTDSPLSH